MVSDLRSCTMLSTLPLFYIAQSVNSDDRRTRIQGLRVIMNGHNIVPTLQRCVALKSGAAQLCFVTEIAPPQAATTVVVCEQRPYPV